jgi:hypothetical protein
MAEAMAINLASMVAKFLNMNQVTYNLDNQVLVTTLQKRDIISTPGHWNLRRILADFFKSNYGIPFEVRKIKRETNKIAHFLATNAWKQADRITPSISCKHIFHSVQCPILDYLRHCKAFPGVTSTHVKSLVFE